MNKNVTECPKCLNTTGFTFGTCSDCGWNYISNNWTRIEAYVNEISPSERYKLISIHERRVAEGYGWRRKQKETLQT